MQRKSRSIASLPESFVRNLNLYALGASAAGVGALAMAQPAEAKIIYTPAHVKLIGWTGYPIDLNHDGINDFALSVGYSTGLASFSTWEILAAGLPFRSPNVMAGAKSKNGKFSLARALKAGDRIGPNHISNTFGFLVRGLHATNSKSSINSTTGQWINVKRHYLGLAFQIKGEKHYGWARLDVKVNKRYPVFDALLTGYAYETIPNKAIIAGKTKGPDVVTVEPGSLGALAAGASRLQRGRN